MSAGSCGLNGSEWRIPMSVFPFLLKTCDVCAAGAETLGSPEESVTLPSPFLFTVTPYVSAAAVRFTWMCWLILRGTFFFFRRCSKGRSASSWCNSLTTVSSCLVCSKSYGTPLGKMRGLITVKLANEQVNYRTKFLYKNCHFSERCSHSCSRRLKKRGGSRVEEEKRAEGECLLLLSSRELPGFCPS